MAKAGKRKADSGAGGTSTTKRVTSPKAKVSEDASRYTAKGSKATKRPPSPKWVPILMFALWIIGLLLIILNYMGLMPGGDDLSGWYLVAGLGAMLAGIMVATQYR